MELKHLNKKLFTIIALIMVVSGCIQEAAENVKTPQVDLNVNVKGISNDGLEMSVDTLITNPNPLNIEVGDIGIVVKNADNEVLKQITLDGETIKANDKKTFCSEIAIPVSFLNEKTIVINMQTDVGAGGIDVRLPVEAKTTVLLPAMSSLVKPIKTHPDIVIKALEKEADVDVKISNSNSFGLVIDDIAIEMFDESGNKIGNGKISGDTISANSDETFSGVVRLTSVPGGNKVTTTIKTNVGIEGVSEKMPLEASMTVTVEIGKPPLNLPSLPTPPPIPTLPPLPQFPQ